MPNVKFETTPPDSVRGLIVRGTIKTPPWKFPAIIVVNNMEEDNNYNYGPIFFSSVYKKQQII